MLTMANSAICATLPCPSPSLFTTAPLKCMLPCKLYHCPFIPTQCSATNYSRTTFRNFQHSLQHVQSGIQAQANQVLGVQMLEESSQLAEDEHEEGDEDPYVQVGYICNVHGLRGEVRVLPSTDFPEERFAKPGVRWLRLQRYGDMTIKEFELVSGRSHSKKDQWLVSFKGVDSVDQVKELVGATMLVKDDDRPSLEDNEYFSRDLVGMNVVLKDTNKLVGTVVGVYNTGGSDLLRVMLSQTEVTVAGTRIPVAEEETSAPLIWIPFVRNIVPDVDIKERVLRITPPEGLLELNLRSKGLTSKERHQQDFKQKRKLRQKVAAIRKKLHEMGQEHILCGLSTGNESQKQALLDQLLNLDFKLFKHALQASEGAYERSDLSRFLDMKLTRNYWLRLEQIGKNRPQFERKEYMNKDTLQLRRDGLKLIARGQVAVILLMDEEQIHIMNSDNERRGDQGILPNWLHPWAEQVVTIQKLAHLDSVEKFPIPLIFVATKDTLPFVRSIFEENDYFGLEEKQVWFLAEESLPCFSGSTDEGENKILMESPWKIVEAPIGPGGIFSSFLAQGILEWLTGRGINYMQICTLNDLCAIADPVFFGFVDKQEADVGVKLFAEGVHSHSEQPVSKNHIELESYNMPYKRGEKGYILVSKACPENDDAPAQFFTTGVNKGNTCFDIILSMKYLEKLTKNILKMEYYKEKKHVDHVKEEIQERENAYMLRSSICSLLKFSPSNKTALILYH